MDTPETQTLLPSFNLNVNKPKWNWYTRSHWWNPAVDGEIQTNALDWDATVPIPINITII